MCSARSGNGPTRVNTMTNGWKMNLLQKVDTVFCGENLIVGNLNMCFDTGYPHDGRADNAAYRHNRRADKRRYRHDRKLVSKC